MSREEDGDGGASAEADRGVEVGEDGGGHGKVILNVDDKEGTGGRIGVSGSGVEFGVGRWRWDDEIRWWRCFGHSVSTWVRRSSSAQFEDETEGVGFVLCALCFVLVCVRKPRFFRDRRQRIDEKDCDFMFLLVCVVVCKDDAQESDHCFASRSFFNY